MVEKVALTIPLTSDERQRIEEIAKARGYDDPADYVRALIDEASDQAYFWTPEWQAGEREADEDIAAGRVETFDSMDDLIADLMDDE
jgi:predicted transcriptional regulator